MAILKNTTIQGTSNIQIPRASTADRIALNETIIRWTNTGTQAYSVLRGTAASVTASQWTCPTGVSAVEVLVVGGGGGTPQGGGAATGGGGAGGLIYRSVFAVTAGSAYNITVGQGGNGVNGSNSVFDSLTAIGGGAGGSTTGSSGGSGGGGGQNSNSNLGGAGTTGQGFPGGAASDVNTPFSTAGGGGGAGDRGANGVAANGGGGGRGLNFSISGTSEWYAGGGGGSKDQVGNDAGAGGIGGGGRGQKRTGTGKQNGTPSTGGGAGGDSNEGTTGVGGSGVVIIRYVTYDNALDPDPTGDIRYNTDLNDIEIYHSDRTKWLPVGEKKNFAGHNLLTYSSDLSNAVWNAAQSRATRITTGIADPFGGTGAATYKRVAADGDLIYRIHSGTAGVAYTYSVFIRRRLGTGSVVLTVGDNVTGPDLNITSEWQRYYRTYVPTTTSVRAYISIQGQDDEIDVFGGQLEQDTTSPGPYTPTVDVIHPVPQVVNGYRIHTFTTTGITSFVPACSGKIEVLVVGGGGGGGGGTSGYGSASGGGGGGMIENYYYDVIAGETYTVAVGAGGAGGITGAEPGEGTSGGNSQFGTLIAVGGGAGTGQKGGVLSGRAGGSGGGGAGGGNPPFQWAGAGIQGQGFPGGQGIGSPYTGGGGGGAGGRGSDATSSNNGNGGPGRRSMISGTAVYYAGGGGAGDSVYFGTPGSGGIGGGGNGGNGANGGAATNGRGGGGGGAGTEGSVNTTGGSGGSGIVIARYRYQ